MTLKQFVIGMTIAGTVGAVCAYLPGNLGAIIMFCLGVLCWIYIAAVKVTKK